MSVSSNTEEWIWGLCSIEQVYTNNIPFDFASKGILSGAKELLLV